MTCFWTTCLLICSQNNLLNSRTIQAHCTFLSPPSLAHLSMRETAIAHCPLSNAYFSAEPFRLREALQQGVKVGLGSDIAGGYSIDIMDAMRHAVLISRMREGSRIVSRDQTSSMDSDSKESLAIDWRESLYLATRGGAIAAGLPIGVFAVGSAFDAQQSMCSYVLHSLASHSYAPSTHLRSCHQLRGWSTRLF